MYQISLPLLCAGEQLPLEVQRPAQDRQRWGNQWLRTSSCSSITRSRWITPSALPAGIPALVYQDGSSAPKSFTAAEITTDQTGLGTLVSVALVTSIDTGGERFGFFLPQLDVPRGQSEEFRTVGVYERFSGPDSIPHRDPSWRCIELHGTAQTVIVEL